MAYKFEYIPPTTELPPVNIPDFLTGDVTQPTAYIIQNFLRSSKVYNFDQVGKIVMESVNENGEIVKNVVNIAMEKIAMGNGEVKEYARVVEEVAGAGGGAAATFAGTKLALTSIPLQSAATVFGIGALGVVGGKLLYDAAPEFWDARAEELMAAAQWIGDGIKGIGAGILSFFDGDSGNVVVPEGVFSKIRNSVSSFFTINPPKEILKYNNIVFNKFKCVGNLYTLTCTLNFQKVVNNSLEYIKYDVTSINKNVKIISFIAYSSGTYRVYVGFVSSNSFTITYNYKYYNTTIYTSTLTSSPLTYNYNNVSTTIYYKYHDQLINSNNGILMNQPDTFDGFDPNYVMINQTTSTFQCSHYLANLYFSDITGFEYDSNVTQPNSSQTVTENYPNWATTPLGSGLGTGLQIGLDALKTQDPQPSAELQTQTQQPPSIDVNTLTPGVLKQLEEFINNIVTTESPKGSINENPFPNTGTQIEPEPQPLPNPNKNPSGIGTPPINPNPEPEPGDEPIVPIIPTTSGSNKLYTVYNPSVSQLNQLGNFLWNLFDSGNPVADLIDAFKKLWQNPLDGVISLATLYAPVSTGATQSIWLGSIDSGVDAPVVSNQFSKVSLGSVNISEILHNVTDYTPYCSMHLYLPFIGFVEIDGDDFMNGTMSIDYMFDVYTGTCLATVYSQRTPDMPSRTPLYTFSGSAAQQLPLTSASANGLISGLVSATGAVLGGATGGALALTGLGQLTHGMVHINRSGSITASSGILSSKTPAVVISRRNSYDAYQYNKLYGFPSNMTTTLSSCSGFTRVKDIHLKSYATQEEKDEIVQLLKKGVII